MSCITIVGVCSLLQALYAVTNRQEEGTGVPVNEVEIDESEEKEDSLFDQYEDGGSEQHNGVSFTLLELSADSSLAIDAATGDNS